jgi:hypothetical protein
MILVIHCLCIGSGSYCFFTDQERIEPESGSTRSIVIADNYRVRDSKSLVSML